jgi:hypothetical protein
MDRIVIVFYVLIDLIDNELPMVARRLWNGSLSSRFDDRTKLICQQTAPLNSPTLTVS